ncbi:hypothetical protein DPX16_6495 [Anabarilius grahami]|uniref:Ig-like domain-containing protein n=1 Tax=Anabarilius grahami TaxID=495550 RepID=A0A3N0YDV2_ANAGA|nr:hypothetical protein DPX16_6495 [Anabarilius grahami]
MNIFQESWRSILGVLLVFFLRDLIRDVQIESSDSWLPSKNICMFHLWCQASGDPNPSYSWSGNTVKTGPNLNISLHPAESATLNCTANNTVSIKHTTKTVITIAVASSTSGGDVFPVRTWSSTRPLRLQPAPIASPASSDRAGVRD